MYWNPGYSVALAADSAPSGRGLLQASFNSLSKQDK